MNLWIIACVLFVQCTEVSSHTYHQTYNSVDIHWSHCGQFMWPFDAHTHICCKGYVRPLLGPMYLNKCCGTLNYNRRSHWCCAGKVRRNFLNSASARPRCCGRSSYNPKKQTCCDGFVTDTNVPSYIPSACCGRNSYNPFKQTCCHGEVQNLVGGFLYTQCCGERSINTKMEKCCNGVARYTSDPYNDKCCGKTLIHKKVEKCCDDKNGKIVSVWERCPNETDNFWSGLNILHIPAYKHIYSK